MTCNCPTPHPALAPFEDRRHRATLFLDQLIAQTIALAPHPWLTSETTELALDRRYRELGRYILELATSLSESKHPKEVEALRDFLNSKAYSGLTAPEIHIGVVDPGNPDIPQLVSIVAYLIADGSFTSALSSCSMLVILTTGKHEYELSVAQGLPEPDYNVLSLVAYNDYWNSLQDWLTAQ